MVRLLLVEVITSFTKDRTKARDSCRGWAPHSCGCWPQDPAAPPGPAHCGLPHLQEGDKEGLELLLKGPE